jgi:hypothetical protein
MQVPIFLAADYASQEAGGKLNVLGIFNQIYVSAFPAALKSLYLVIRIELELGEFDEEHAIKIIFVDEDGREKGHQSLTFSTPRPGSTFNAFIDLLVQIEGLLLEAPGRHEFRLVVNRDTKSILPIEVTQRVQSAEHE